MFGFALSVSFLLEGPALVQHGHKSANLKELGQSVLVALSEIVDLFRENLNSDWENVDVPALQQQLVDMDFVAAEASAVATLLNGAVGFEVIGSTRVVEAPHCLADAHAPLQDAKTGWKTEFTKKQCGEITWI